MLSFLAKRNISSVNQPAQSNLFDNTLHAIRFMLNGKLVELSEGKFDPTDSLVTYLRSEKVNLKGTKRGCEEGGCGACTVIMSSFDPILKRVKHRAINSCLMPIGNLHNTSITTIERLTQNSKSKNSLEANLNPIQKAIQKHHATQCGFCTPGFIMSTLALLLENPTPTNEDIMQYLDGNVCRCTGYGAILEALREFTIDSNPNDQIIAQNIRNKKDEQITDSEKKSLNREIIESLSSISDLSSLKSDQKSISIYYNGHLYSIPSTFEELIELKKNNPKSKIIVGNTELFSSAAPNDKFDYISTNLLDELKYIRKSDNILRIGASTTIDDVFEFCKKDTTNNRVLRALKEKISVFASNQTRNVACIIGNIVVASPSTDFTNFLPAVGAKLKVVDCLTKTEREISFDNFFLDRYKTVLKETDVIKELSFNIDSLLPNGTRNENANTDHIFVYKIANRREIAGCILSATIRADISEDNSNRINGIRIAFSKLSNTNPIGRAKKAEQFLIGKGFTLENIEKSLDYIDEEFPISDEIDDGLDKYRRNLGHNLLIKFYHQTQKERGKLNEYDESIVNDSYFSTTFSNINSDLNSDYFELSSSHIPELSVSCQCKEDGTAVPLNRLEGSESIGKSVTHLAAPLQVQGKAEFTDDIPLESEAKHAAFVTSTIAHGNIKRINYETDELKKHHFTIITAKDLIKTANKVGFNNEEFLVSKEVTYYGQPIAIVVADSEREAWRIAKSVQIEYEPLPVNSCIEESIESGNAFKGPCLSQGRDVDQIFSEIEKDGKYRVLEGSVRMGGQYHFYLEPNASVASHSSDGQYLIRPTTRDLDTARNDAAKHLGIGENRVDVDVKRLGGAFCSKLNRTAIISSATAIASQKVGCQVKMRLPRDVDTHIMSGDHSVLANYKVGVELSTGKVEALKIDFFVDSGFSYVNNADVAMKMLLHSDSVYNFANFQFNSFLCQTNKISNAHFRGCGSQNAGVVIESIFERIAHSIRDDQKLFDPADLKKANFYKLNDKTPYGVVLDDINIDSCWSLIKDKSRYSDLSRCVRAFNLINKHKKRGLSITPVKFGVGHSFAPGRRASSVVHLLKDGTILVCHSGVEQGQGLHTKMSCIAAKVLDIPVDRVHIDCTNTAVNTEGTSTGAGYTNDIVGFAIIDACEKLKKRIEKFYFTTDKNGQKVKRTFSDVVKLAYLSKIDLTAHGFYISPQPGFDFEKKEGRPYQYYEYGAGVALVEIDTLTGQHKILESHVVFDAGQSLNPGIDIGQIEGGFMQGVGWMTTEEAKYMKRGRGKLNAAMMPGKPLNDTMYKYKIPTFSSVPLKFSAHLLPDSHNKIGVMSSKGVGEPPNMLANSVGFALIDAIEAGRKEIGKGRLSNYEFPLTPDKVLHYLNK